ncbi:hypothetical protein Vretimale_13547 [Volvox reticuliferus]|uniref:Uncharacterized protein n=1 Tax=Volvox reticuliferus TaxID=1737510 RepID=A0A8J4LTN4_9CHLO|nr:hypothetical protein Vretifemale_378 [Volvox reticuliferus]GIM09744.1 hypothetical protein Vretimale_13547 [Volvox reticuliferus]
MGTMELVPASNVGETSPPYDLRNLGPVLHAAQLQYQRQKKNLHAIQRQFELMAESNSAWRERERRREEKYMLINQERQTQRENLVEYSNRMAEKRAERLETAYRHAEAMRAAAQAKVQAVEDRMVRFAEERADHAASERQRIAALEAKREATYRHNLELLAERRQTILAHERKVEDMLRQREELKQLQAQIKAEEDFLREQQRRAIKARAEDELAERVAHFHAKATAKDEQTARRKKEIEDQRRMRAEELRQRFEYIAAQAHEAAMMAEAERQMLAGKIEDKVARADALATHRAALLSEMQTLRYQMQRQEEYLRSSLMRMQQLGIAEVPAQVVRSMEKVQLAGPLMTEAVLSGGWAPPQLMLEGAVLSSDGGLGQGPGLAAGTAVALAGSVAGVGAAAGTMTPKAMRVRMGRTRRPKSAGPTPRGTRGVAQSNGGSYSAGGRGSYSNGGRGYQSAGGRGSYQSVMASPRVTSAGGKGGRLGGYARPASAGAVLCANTASSASSPVTPTAAAGGRPVPYAPYTVPVVRQRGGLRRRQTLEEEVAASVDTALLAAEAAVSGRYDGVHEVARPGSRREEELRVVLQEEIAKESERQSILTKVTDEDERARLVKYFTHEREEARRRILALSSAAQAALYH